MNISSDTSAINPHITDSDATEQPPETTQVAQPNADQSRFLDGLYLAMTRSGEEVPRLKLSGGPGVGKAQPLDCKILMANGSWKQMGDICIGDELASIDGNPSRVIAIHPQGIKPVTQVTTRDGRSTRCCDDHLWSLTLGRGSGWRTVSTTEMKRLNETSKYIGRVGLPLFSGKFGKQWVNPVDPYILGALLGDGGLTGKSITFTTANLAVVNEIRNLLPEGYELRKYAGDYQYGLTRVDATVSKPNMFTSYLRTEGIMGHKSIDKFIPESIFESDRLTRLSVIQGLMDTDGTVGKNGSTCFEVASERLAKDFQRLVQSIGAVSRITFKVNDTAGCWRQVIRHKEPHELFRYHQWRTDRAVKTQYSDRLNNKIAAVEPTGSAQCQCITVSHPSNLYITDDYIVTHNSFTIAMAAQEAAAEGWVVFLVGPTHQATGVLAAAVPLAFPFEPDPKNMLRAGEVMFCTAHKLGKWVQKSRARGAVQGERDPVPRDSWLGRAFRADWNEPPKGALIIADETSMYPGQMVAAIEATLRTLKEACKTAVFVAVGDPQQLTPVRGPSYIYTPGEGPESPSELVQEHGFESYQLTENMRAKDPMLRKVVETYLNHRTVPLPEPEFPTYKWADANEEFYYEWAQKVQSAGEAKTVMLGYRRATVAFANDRICQIIHGSPAYELHADRKMRVQETYSPSGRTLAASSDLIEIRALHHVEDDILDLILPPQKGHAAAHDERVLAIMRELIETDLEHQGPFPVADIAVFGDRAGFLQNVPVSVASEHNTDTPTETRWASLSAVIANAAFRRRHSDDQIRRGLSAIFYHMSDSAMMKIEAPFAMTSHRAQGSTYAHVAVLADGVKGGRVVDHRVESARDASAYVMLSRASQSLIIAWTPRLSPSNSAFSF